MCLGNDEKEILKLNRKIARSAPKGFVYKINDASYVHENKAKVKEEAFSTNDELKQKDVKERVIN